MLSVEKCRKILGSNCDLSDSELESLRGQLYGLADISIGLFRTKKLSLPELEARLSTLSDEERDEWEERAAILEYEAGLDRAEAETLAFGYLHQEE